MRLSMGRVETRSQNYAGRDAAPVAAACATTLSLIFVFSYLRNGGGIHGSRTSPGLWTTLGPVSAGALVSSLLLAAIGRCRGKLLMVGWLFGIFAAEYVIFQVAFD
jgi:hypothetical protein